MSGDPVTLRAKRRTCKGCKVLFVEPWPWPGDRPRGFCSKGCHRRFKTVEAIKSRKQKSRAEIVGTRSAKHCSRRTFTPASVEQRDAVRRQPCLVDASHRSVEPAHLIPRAMLLEGQEDPRAVVPLCPICHRHYDSGELDLLRYLEPAFRIELAFAVERFGLISTLRRVTNDRQS